MVSACGRSHVKTIIGQYLLRDQYLLGVINTYWRSTGGINIFWGDQYLLGGYLSAGQSIYLLG